VIAAKNVLRSILTDMKSETVAEQDLNEGNRLSQSALPATAPDPKFKDIIIAVHGIGSQSRNATVRSVATRFARSIALSDPKFSPLSPQPLGYFHTDVQGAIKVAPLDRFGKNGCILAGIGFSEVFWADIPEGVVQEKRTLEETKAWARTVVARARAVFYRGWNQLTETERQRLREPDFGQAGEVLEEVIDTVQVLENLCFLAQKAGVMKINIREVLSDYLGDVQLVTEYAQYRNDIIGRFHGAMEQIHNTYPNARLHIVAHSEGTVVSFLGLLQAMSAQRLPRSPGAAASATLTVPTEPPAWLRRIHGYMTIGSPIDKHILLWPELFENFDLTRARKIFEDRARQNAEENPADPVDRGIEWRNYYDLGDPVGFELDTVRRWLKTQPFNPFHFIDDDQTKHDIGFARYMWPGKAHNDYWEDPAVFEHFVCDVVRPSAGPAPKPRTRPLVALVSPMIPYLLSFTVLFAGVLLFYKMVATYIHPPLDPVQNYAHYMTLGTTRHASAPFRDLLWESFLVTLLVSGTTLLSRFPRLLREWKWLWWGAVSFIVGAAAYGWGITEFQEKADVTYPLNIPGLGDPVNATIGLAFIVGLIGLIAVPKTGSMQKRARAAGKNVYQKLTRRKPGWLGDRPTYRRPTRRVRFFRRGMRPLIFSGAIAVSLLIAVQVWHENKHPSTITQTEKNTAMSAFLGTTNLASVSTNSPEWRTAEARLGEIERLLQPHPPLWPVVLSGLAFLYLWWLAGLLFDLAFIWQKYIRDSSPLGRFRKCAPLPTPPNQASPEAA